MAAGMIEHRGIVQRIDGDRAVVAMETGGCSSCGHGSSCSIGKMAEGRPATLLVVPATPELKVGEMVRIGLPESRLTFSALLGYLFPAFAMLLGAGIGNEFSGNDAATALGAICGFVGALIVARIAIAVAPHLLPAPRLLTDAARPTLSQQE